MRSQSHTYTDLLRSLRDGIGDDTVNLLDTQIGLVEAEQGIAIIPSFGIPDCRRRGLTMSELIEPVVSLEFYQITRRGTELPGEAAEFSEFLKTSIARWAGEAGIL